MKKSWIGLLLILFLLVTGCSQKPTSTSSGESETPKQTQFPERTEEKTAPEATATPSSEVLDGKKLIDERCAVCHTLEKVQSAQKDRAGWEITVERMIQSGARLTEEEKNAVIDYLAGQ